MTWGKHFWFNLSLQRATRDIGIPRQVEKQKQKQTKERHGLYMGMVSKFGKEKTVF